MTIARQRPVDTRVDDAKELLIASLDRWAEAKKDTPGHRTAEELRNRVSPLIAAARDLPAALLTEETWECGARWASRRDPDGPDAIRALVESLNGSTDSV